MKYNIWNNLKIGIYSPTAHIESSITKNQKRVFDFFKIHINQIYNNSSHANFLTNISRTEDVDYFIFFDIDAIPLKANFLDVVMNRVVASNCILGVEQLANHIEKSEIFAGPACFIISKKIYEQLGSPSFNANNFDVGGCLTVLAKKQNITVEYFKVTSYRTKRWFLDWEKQRYFGNGTIYEDLIYHEFDSRDDNHQLTNFFIRKCNDVIEGTI